MGGGNVSVHQWYSSARLFLSLYLSLSHFIYLSLSLRLYLSLYLFLIVLLSWVNDILSVSLAIQSHLISNQQTMKSETIEIKLN